SGVLMTRLVGKAAFTATLVALSRVTSGAFLCRASRIIVATHRAGNTDCAAARDAGSCLGIVRTSAATPSYPQRPVSPSRALSFSLCLTVPDMVARLLVGG